MTRFGLFLGMLVLVLASGTGCGLRRCLMPCCGDCGRGNCGLASCGSTCGVANDPILGDYTRCGVCGGGNCPGFTPLAFLKYRLTCGSGCGNQLYYGEWISDPPACCDPCDNCGNYTGPQCGGQGRPIGPLLREMWGGYPYVGSCCGGSCGSGSCSSGGGYSGHGPAMNNGPRIESGPRRPASDEVDEGPETVKPSKAMPNPPSRQDSMEPKAARPTEAKRVSYQRPGVPMRPGSYRGNPQQYQQYPRNQQSPANSQYPQDQYPPQR